MIISLDYYHIKYICTYIPISQAILSKFLSHVPHNDTGESRVSVKVSYGDHKGVQAMTLSIGRVELSIDNSVSGYAPHVPRPTFYRFKVRSVQYKLLQNDREIGHVIPRWSSDGSHVGQYSSFRISQVLKNVFINLQNAFISGSYEQCIINRLLHVVCT